MEYFYPDIYLTFEQFDFINYLHSGGQFVKLAENGGFFYILPDIVNQMWFLLIIFLFYYYNLVGFHLFVFLLITSFSPFLINDILFPASYMPDQFSYFKEAYKLRNFNSLMPFDDFLIVAEFS